MKVCTCPLLPPVVEPPVTVEKEGDESAFRVSKPTSCLVNQHPNPQIPVRFSSCRLLAGETEASDLTSQTSLSIK